MKTKTSYRSLLAKLHAATTKAELDKLEALCTRIYDAGQLTASELSRLDVKIMEKGAVLPSTANP